MLGSQENPGLMILTVKDLFDQMKITSDTVDYIVKVSFMEVYNETLRDLLVPGPTNLDIREDPEKGMVVAGVNEVICEALPEVLSILK